MVAGFRIKSLAWMIALFGATLVAPASARAQCTEVEETAFLLLDSVGLALEDLEFLFGTNPSGSDCTKVCRSLGKGCQAGAKSFSTALSSIGKAISTASKTACKSAVDTRGCKLLLKIDQQLLKEALAQIKTEFAQVCGAPALTLACQNACNNGILPTTCEDVFP